jgi:hypothetical protein
MPVLYNNSYYTKKFEDIFKVKILSLTKSIEKLRNLIKEEIIKLFT